MGMVVPTLMVINRVVTTRSTASGTPLVASVKTQREDLPLLVPVSRILLAPFLMRKLSVLMLAAVPGRIVLVPEIITASPAQC